MVNRDHVMKMLKSLDYTLTDQIERIIYDPQLSYMSWEEIARDIDLSIEIRNTLESDNSKLNIRSYLETNFYDEELEALINRLMQAKNEQF